MSVDDAEYVSAPGALHMQAARGIAGEMTNTDVAHFEGFAFIDVPERLIAGKELTVRGMGKVVGHVVAVVYFYPGESEGWNHMGVIDATEWAPFEVTGEVKSSFDRFWVVFFYGAWKEPAGNEGWVDDVEFLVDGVSLTSPGGETSLSSSAPRGWAPALAEALPAQRWCDVSGRSVASSNGTAVGRIPRLLITVGAEPRTPVRLMGD